MTSRAPLLLACLSGNFHSEMLQVPARACTPPCGSGRSIPHIPHPVPCCDPAGPYRQGMPTCHAAATSCRRPKPLRRQVLQLWRVRSRLQRMQAAHRKGGAARLPCFGVCVTFCLRGVGQFVRIYPSKGNGQRAACPTGCHRYAGLLASALQRVFSVCVYVCVHSPCWLIQGTKTKAVDTGRQSEVISKRLRVRRKRQPPGEQRRATKRQRANAGVGAGTSASGGGNGAGEGGGEGSSASDAGTRVPRGGSATADLGGGVGGVGHQLLGTLRGLAAVSREDVKNETPAPGLALVAGYDSSDDSGSDEESARSS